MAGSFNNFHGRLHSLFYVLSDDKMGSMPRFAPGSLANRQLAMDVDPEVVVIGGSKRGKLVSSGHASFKFKKKGWSRAWC
jgi:hypothetical protein